MIGIILRGGKRFRNHVRQSITTIVFLSMDLYYPAFPVSMEYDFHGIIVKESLENKSLLDEVEILGTQKGRDWELIRVGLNNSKREEFIKSVRRNLKSEGGVPFYAHFYSKDKLIIVFPGKMFEVTPNRNTWKAVIDYGLSQGIPIEQLDFFPCRFQDETY